MKTRVTLFLTFLFVSVFTFGQNNSLKNIARTHHHFKLNKQVITSVNSLKMRFDSIIFNNNEEKEKEVYFYDNITKNTKRVYYRWENNAWVEDDMTEYFCDDNGNVSSYIYYEYNEASGNLEPNAKTVLGYNENNLVINKEEYSYNNNNWKKQIKYGYEYNDNGQLTIEYEYSVDDGEWELDTKTNYNYENDNLISKIHLNFTGSDWEFNTKYEYTYEANNLVKESYYTRSNDTWNISSGKEYSYNDNNDMIQKIYYHYTDNNVVYDYKHTYTFDNNHNALIEIDYQWDTDDWLEYRKYEYSYNTNYLLSETILPFESVINDIDFKYLNILKTSKYFTKSDNDWSQIATTTLYYSEHDLVSTQEKQSTKNIKVYPNPASDYINVSFANNTKDAILFNLFNIQGQIVLSKTIKNNEQINISNLPKGMYLYNVSVNSDIFSGKICK